MMSSEGSSGVSHARMVDYLRDIHARPSGTGAILNLFRGAKVRGAADLNVLADVVADPGWRLDLARHGFDEVRHSYLLLRRMEELHFRAFRLPPQVDRVEGLFERCRARDVKDVYADRGSVNEAELMELAAAVFIPEKDAVLKLRANYEALADDPRTQTLVGIMLRDDERHVDYLGAWLLHFERRFSPRAVKAALDRLRAVFDDLNFVYYGSLEDYFVRAATAAVSVSV
jgi:hypothetical protein